MAVRPRGRPAPARTVSPPAVVTEEPDAELLEIFLEEAREVVGNGLAALDTLASSPSDVAELTTCAVRSTRSRAARGWSG
jgi:chemosensory pili system protein ChpA (sensor histidine kinase/response regulator)